MKRILIYQLPPFVWAILIYFLTAIPGIQLVLAAPAGIDKLIHAALYFILCWLTWRAFYRQEWYPALKEGAPLGAFIFCVVYGFLDEYHQSFIPGRSPEFYNALADTGGALLFIALMLLRHHPNQA